MKITSVVAVVLLAVASSAAHGEANAEVAAAPEAKERKILFDLDWDAGPTYEFGFRSRLRDLDPKHFAKDTGLHGRVGGSLSLDGGYLAFQCCEDSGFAGAVRRARLYTRGELQWGVATEYKFEFAVERAQIFLNDFYLRWRPSRFIDTVKVGYFEPAYSLGSIASSSARPLLETASPISAFAPGYRSGIEVAKRYESPDLSWVLNLSSVGQQQNDGDASSSMLRAVGRVVWRPLRDDAATAPTLLHLGFDLQQEIAGQGDVRYRSRPESFLSPNLVDTGDILGNATSTDFEVAWRRGPLTVEGEWLQSFVHPSGGDTLYFHGLYAQAVWVLTGETRPYDLGSSSFGRIEPAHPLDPRAGRWGAFEVAARASWLDLSDSDVHGGRMVSVSGGVVWIWNRWVRVLADYVFADTADRSDATFVHIVQTRLEFVF